MNDKTRRNGLLPVLTALALASISAQAAELAKAKDGSGVYGYKDTPKLPWCEWLVHDPDRPAPKRVDPGEAKPALPTPRDAVILFDGKSLDQWEPAPGWKLENGELVSGDGSLKTKAQFGTMQLHVEFMCPPDFKGPWYNNGNNGVVLMGQFEIQIFDSYNEKIYPDGQCAAIYGQTPPTVNVSRPPGQWQTFDIFFVAPKFNQGKLESPARATVIHNGVKVHDRAEIHGEISHRGLPEYRQKTENGPLVLGGHGCPVRFRNIWLREMK